MKHTLAVLVQNRPGVLSRVAALFSRRGYNIESIAVGATENPQISRMTIVVDGETCNVETIAKNLHKLVEVLKVTDLTQDSMIDRELAMVKVTADQTNRFDILQIVNIFRAHIVDVCEHSVIVEVTGDAGKVDAMVKLLEPYGIKEIVRTGCIAMARGHRLPTATRPSEIA